MYKVLIVEDEAKIRKGFIKSIDWEALGCTVCAEAENGCDGLQKIRTLRPEIVFTDILMPVMDGLEMLAIAKKEYNFEAVVLSGYGEFAYAQRAITIGVSDYILKPFDESTILELINSIKKRLVEKTLVNEHHTGQNELSVPLTSSHYTLRGYDYLIENYYTGTTGADIAEFLDISPGYFYKIFKTDTGMSIRDFITKLKLSKAVSLLKSNPNLKIYEVADMVGFSDYKYFHRVFSEEYGDSPLKYKQNLFEMKEQL
ncbi:MAG: response regulator [Oscillospiraceae bacterium]